MAMTISFRSKLLCYNLQRRFERKKINGKPIVNSIPKKKLFVLSAALVPDNSQNGRENKNRKGLRKTRIKKPSTGD